MAMQATVGPIRIDTAQVWRHAAREATVKWRRSKATWIVTCHILNANQHARGCPRGLPHPSMMCGASSMTRSASSAERLYSCRQASVMLRMRYSCGGAGAVAWVSVGQRGHEEVETTPVRQVPDVLTSCTWDELQLQGCRASARARTSTSVRCLGKEW